MRCAAVRRIGERLRRAAENRPEPGRRAGPFPFPQGARSNSAVPIFLVLGRMVMGRVQRPVVSRIAMEQKPAPFFQPRRSRFFAAPSLFVEARATPGRLPRRDRRLRPLYRLSIWS